ncbi:hypothetical protein J4439_06235 [Candidatus Woesearchaeota archaeon]|nr:hypothetical protein [Candidatus Woesearchaeota archaeon]
MSLREDFLNDLERLADCCSPVPELPPDDGGLTAYLRELDALQRTLPFFSAHQPLAFREAFYGHGEGSIASHLGFGILRVEENPSELERDILPAICCHELSHLVGLWAPEPLVTVLGYELSAAAALAGDGTQAASLASLLRNTTYIGSYLLSRDKEAWKKRVCGMMPGGFIMRTEPQLVALGPALFHRPEDYFVTPYRAVRRAKGVVRDRAISSEDIPIPNLTAYLSDPTFCWAARSRPAPERARSRCEGRP